jgi:hypothetical protein
MVGNQKKWRKDTVKNCKKTQTHHLQQRALENHAHSEKKSPKASTLVAPAMMK